jgi:hypothetical protein
VLKKVTYQGLDGPIEVEYDSEAPCRVCGLPVKEASVGGTDVCPWCDAGFHRDGRRWSYSDLMRYTHGKGETVPQEVGQGDRIAEG